MKSRGAATERLRCVMLGESQCHKYPSIVPGRLWCPSRVGVWSECGTLIIYAGNPIKGNNEDKKIRVFCADLLENQFQMHFGLFGQIRFMEFR